MSEMTKSISKVQNNRLDMPKIAVWDKLPEEIIPSNTIHPDFVKPTLNPVVEEMFFSVRAINLPKVICWIWIVLSSVLWLFTVSIMSSYIKKENEKIWLTLFWKPIKEKVSQTDLEMYKKNLNTRYKSDFVLYNLEEDDNMIWEIRLHNLMNELSIDSVFHKEIEWKVYNSFQGGRIYNNTIEIKNEWDWTISNDQTIRVTSASWEKVILWRTRSRTWPVFFFYSKR